MTKLSVVIPVGGQRLKNLDHCLFGLAQQTLPASEFEVIVVNDGAEEVLFEVVVPYLGRLDLRYLWTPKYEPGRGDSPPRNKGARLARYSPLVFLDSDVILDRQALGLYAEDFEANPDGVVAGLYDWLPPAQFGQREIMLGLDHIYYLVDDEHLALKVPQLPWPSGQQTHNVCRDMRRPMFLDTSVAVVYTGPGHQNVALGCFSGNLGISATTFWRAGGYWDDLSAGLVDDGAFGLTLWALSFERLPDSAQPKLDEAGQPITHPEFGIRLDQRIRGAHQYHDRNLNWVQQQSAREVDLIDRRFGLGNYTDGRAPVLPRPVHGLTEEAQRAWGVDRWKKTF